MALRGYWFSLNDSLIHVAKRIQRRLLSAQYLGLRYQPDSFPALPTAHSHLLIFKPDDIGDAVLGLPGLAALKRRFPKARFCLLCQEKTAPLYRRTGLFDEIVAVPVTVRALRFQSFDFEKAMSQFSVSRFNLAIFYRTYPAFFKQFLRVNADIHVHPRDPRMRSVSLFQSKVTLWDEHRPPMHQQLGEILAPLLGSEGTKLAFPKFQWTEQDRQDVEKAVEKTLGRALPKSFGVLHPYNRLETKRFPEAEFCKLVAKLKLQFAFPWIVIGGKEDPDLDLGENVFSLNGKLSLAATGYLMSRATAFIGNESGPGHWAAALGVPTVTLMGGHSNPIEWAPVGKSLVLRHDVSCSPCHRRVCSQPKRYCLENMTVKDLVNPIVRFLEDPESTSGILNVGSETPANRTQPLPKMLVENVPG